MKERMGSLRSPGDPEEWSEVGPSLRMTQQPGCILGQGREPLQVVEPAQKNSALEFPLRLTH